MNDQMARFLIFFISIFVAIYRYIIFAHILLSWFPKGWMKIRGILGELVAPFSKIFGWAKIGSIDFSLILAFILINYVGDLAISYLAALL